MRQTGMSAFQEGQESEVNSVHNNEAEATVHLGASSGINMDDCHVLVSYNWAASHVSVVIKANPLKSPVILRNAKEALQTQFSKLPCPASGGAPHLIPTT